MQSKAVSVKIKLNWTPIMLIEVLSELVSGGFTWIDTALFS